MADPLVIESILGDRGDAALAERLHELAHQGAVEILSIAQADLPRRRFHVATDHGTACFVSLPRELRLFDGAVLHLDAERAVVVRVGEEQWLRLEPMAGAAAGSAALELGYLAGNLHWRVRFDGPHLLVALEGPRQRYLDRLAEFQARGKVRVLD